MSESNWGGAGKGAMQGFQLGSQSGNPWVAAIAAVVGFFVGLTSESAETKALKKNIKLAEDMNQATIREMNRQLSHNSMEQQYIINSTERALFDTQRQSGALQGAMNAYVGNFELIGNSVKHAESDLTRQRDEADQQTIYNMLVGINNSNNRVTDITNRARAAYKDVREGFYNASNTKGSGGAQLMDFIDKAMSQGPQMGGGGMGGMGGGSGVGGGSSVAAGQSYGSYGSWAQTPYSGGGYTGAGFTSGGMGASGGSSYGSMFGL